MPDPYDPLNPPQPQPWEPAPRGERGYDPDRGYREVVTPDEVIAPDGTVAEWDDPSCPVCESGWSAGPEKDRWGRWHCWKCGYRPGQHVAALPGAPAQPDWARLVNDAVRDAMRSEPQLMAVAMTAALGQDGLADLARKQQEALGMAEPSPGYPPSSTHTSSGSHPDPSRPAGS